MMRYDAKYNAGISSQSMLSNVLGICNKELSNTIVQMFNKCSTYEEFMLNCDLFDINESYVKYAYVPPSLFIKMRPKLFMHGKILDIKKAFEEKCSNAPIVLLTDVHEHVDVTKFGTYIRFSTIGKNGDIKYISFCLDNYAEFVFQPIDKTMKMRQIFDVAMYELANACR